MTHVQAELKAAVEELKELVQLNNSRISVKSADPDRYASRSKSISSVRPPQP
jgi:hypothetical protein